MYQGLVSNFNSLIEFCTPISPLWRDFFENGKSKLENQNWKKIILLFRSAHFDQKTKDDL
jgi:hypothetical protein